MATNRYLDWFKQAENDWEWGNHTLDAEHFAQAPDALKKSMHVLNFVRKEIK